MGKFAAKSGSGPDVVSGETVEWTEEGKGGLPAGSADALERFRLCLGKTNIAGQFEGHWAAAQGKEGEEAMDAVLASKFPELATFREQFRKEIAKLMDASDSLEDDEDTPDLRIDDRTVAGPVLGSGGYGEVRAAHRNGTLIASKRVATQGQKWIRREIRNLEAASELAFVVRVLDTRVLPGGREAIINMEYLQGHTLDALLKAGPIPPALAIQISQMAACVVHWFQQKTGFVCRDLKPSNFFITDGGEMKLIDLGLVKRLQNESIKATKSGGVVGTVEYMAPEQVATGTADDKSDTFTLVLMLFKMLTGKVPFCGRTGHETLLKRAGMYHNRAPGDESHLDEIEPPHTQDEEALQLFAYLRDAVARRGLAPNPRDRLSVAELIDRLHPASPFRDPADTGNQKLSDMKDRAFFQRKSDAMGDGREFRLYAQDSPDPRTLVELPEGDVPIPSKFRDAEGHMGSIVKRFRAEQGGRSATEGIPRQALPSTGTETVDLPAPGVKGKEGWAAKTKAVIGGIALATAVMIGGVLYWVRGDGTEGGKKGGGRTGEVVKAELPLRIEFREVVQKDGKKQREMLQFLFKHGSFEFTRSSIPRCVFTGDGDQAWIVNVQPTEYYQFADFVGAQPQSPSTALSVFSNGEVSLLFLGKGVGYIALIGDQCDKAPWGKGKELLERNPRLREMLQKYGQFTRTAGGGVGWISTTQGDLDLILEDMQMNLGHHSNR